MWKDDEVHKEQAEVSRRRVELQMPKPKLDPAKKEGYYRVMATTITGIVGLFLVVEHCWSWGGVDVDDPVGHETYGMIMIAIAYLISARRKGEWLLKR